MGAGTACVGALAWLTALSIFDIRRRRLPNWLTLPGAVAVLTAAVVAGRGAPALLGALALFTVYLVVHLFAPSALGAGDVKLALGLGAFTGTFGVDVWILAAVAAPIMTAGLAAVTVVVRAESTVPHGPSMCLASAAAAALAVV